MRGKPVYLDYQATTPLDPDVLDAMTPFLGASFGNPHSSDHGFGHEASRAVKRGRASVAGLINADDDEIVFTSGATESCNLALRGVARWPGNYPRNRIVTVRTEHPAVLETAMDLAGSGLAVTVLPVGSDGLLDLERLDAVLDERTLLVSVMAVNNEIGVLQPIAEIAARCRAAGALFHTDAAQAAGRLTVDVDALNVDLLTLSSHKLYGPKGIGGLFVRSGVRIQPVITGGGQEGGLRGGTLSPALVAGFGAACELAATRLEGDEARVGALTERLYTGLAALNPKIRLFGHSRRRVAGNLNIGFPGLPAEAVVRNVADRIAVSTGSACASASSAPSKVLLALGVDEQTAATGIRISLGRFTTDEEVDTAISVLSEFAVLTR